MPLQSAHLSSNIFTGRIKQENMRSALSKALIKLGEENNDVVVLTTDLMGSTQTIGFAKAYPKRFVQMGIAEQNMASVGAGLALDGKIPFVVGYAQFNPGRNWDQIKTAIAYSKANVKIVGTHAGLSVGPDGATHQALEDIALTRTLPNMVVLSPADYIETYKTIMEAAKLDGPVYIRLPRAESPAFTTEQTPFEIGKAQVLMQGKDVTIFSTGTMVYESLLAAKELKLKNGVLAEVINVSTIKPLDEVTILSSIKKTRKAITVEDHQVAGGMGSAICELLSENHPVSIKRIGVEDKFGESGEYEKLKVKYGLTAEHIMAEVKSIMLNVQHE